MAAQKSSFAFVDLGRCRRAPSVRTPHVKPCPALTDTNVPDGGLVSPKESMPQQATVPSVRRPHTCPPTLTDVNVPEGGSAPSPQQAIVPSVRRPHAPVLDRLASLLPMARQV